MLSLLEIQITQELQEGLPLVPQPFALIAQKLGQTEEKILQVVADLKERGVIRRFGATIRHQKIGFVANAMVVWEAPPEKISETGQKLANCPEVTHCYQRRPQASWPYQLYSVVHGQNEEECLAIAQRIAAQIEVTDYQVIFSSQELKKTSMKYFVAELEKDRKYDL